MARRDKINYYLDIAEVVLERSTCMRRAFGAVIVKNDQIVSTGYVGSPRGRRNCSDVGECMRMKLDIPRGERYELCRSVHAEMNAIIHASRADMLGSTMYLVGRDMGSGEYVPNAAPCPLCKRVIINAGISNVIVRDDSASFRNIVVHDEWVSNDDSLETESGY